MYQKSFFTALIYSMLAFFAHAQENMVLLSFNSGTSKVIKRGDYVRLAYPAAKIDVKKPNNLQEFLGFRGRVDSISIDKIWLNVDKRTRKQVSFVLADVTAIKKVSKSAEFFTFLASWAVIGSGAALATHAADLNNGAVVFAGIASLFPAAILTANVFYPTKPLRSVGKDYTLTVITIN